MTNYREYTIEVSNSPYFKYVWEHPEKSDIIYDDGYVMEHQGFANSIEEAKDAIDLDIEITQKEEE